MFHAHEVVKVKKKKRRVRVLSKQTEPSRVGGTHRYTDHSGLCEITAEPCDFSAFSGSGVPLESFNLVEKGLVHRRNDLKLFLP